MRACMILPLSILTLFSQPATAGNEATLASPVLTAVGVVCTNSFGSALYRVTEAGAVELAAGPGVGRYFSVSPDGGTIGFKEIAPDGSQRAAVLDLRTGERTFLSDASRQIGQVSFAANGMMAFTRGTDLIVTDGAVERRFALGTYANLAPLSPDAGSVAYNDTDDRIWILDLTSGTRTCLTREGKGYMMPVWSPDGLRIAYTALDGTLFIHDRVSKRTAEVGRGMNASWSGDGRVLVFARAVIERDSLVSSDIISVRYDGSMEKALTQTDDVLELDPSVASDGRTVLFRVSATNTVCVTGVPDEGVSAAAAPAELFDLPLLNVRPAWPTGVSQSSALDIPYVHQVYDTPDWFNGHSACAPTQAIMLLAYYNILPAWPIVCSWPSSHTTAWGNYIASAYRFRGYTFANTAADPNGVPGMGGYGYMWTGSGSPHSRMADYFRAHGVWAAQSEGTPYSTAAADIATGSPFSMCVLLTSAGHLVLAHGFGAEPHTLVFNDPYGNKNQGYMNRNGKNVMYDWPGYNNGFQNLNEVAWCISTRYTAPVTGDTLVDDLQFTNGFTMATTAPASMATWKDLARGFNGHLWYAMTTTGTVDTFFAEWRPALLASGTYQVQAYIELSNATDARYVVRHASGTDTVSVDQKAAAKGWVTLGVWPFAAGTDGVIRLGNRSGVAGQELVFDAVRWVPTTASAVAGGDAHPSSIQLYQNFPNPFNPSTLLRYVLPEGSHVLLEVFNVLGQRVAVLQDGDLPAGDHAVNWGPVHLASGVYLARLQVTTRAGSMAQMTIRMLYNR
jgi:hypothetical protein